MDRDEEQRNSRSSEINSQAKLNGLEPSRGDDKLADCNVVAARSLILKLNSNELIRCT